jgi:HEAT repeat protein
VLGRRSFKTDESFLEKLVLGATGTRAVALDLRRQGHEPIELERGSMDYKIWKDIKIKRVRVPDILCLRCATRFEARAKTHLEISMSHSKSDPERGWDRGLADSDIVAFSLCKKNGPRPTECVASGLIQYVSATALRKAYRRGLVLEEKPKGAGEGFEIRVTWPSAVASADGIVAEVSTSRLQYRRMSDGRTISLGLTRGMIALKPLVKAGDKIREGQLVASVVPVSADIACSKSASVNTFVKMLGSTSISDKYAAAKALSHFKGEKSIVLLSGRMRDDKEHIYVRLESAASLARLGEQTGMDFINSALHDEYYEHRLEAVIILGEIKTESSRTALGRVLSDPDQPPEIRAGGAWALGELGQAESVDALVSAFAEIAEPVRAEAARALRKIIASTGVDVTEMLPAAINDQRAGIAWALSRSGHIDLDALSRAMKNDDTRRWVAYVLGTQKEDAYIGKLDELRRADPEVYFAVTVLWRIMSSWVYGLEEH